LTRKKTEEGSPVGLPTNILHKVHVDKELSWSGDAFELSSKLGTGYSSHTHHRTRTSNRSTRTRTPRHALTLL
jgi:hypothetical protein